MLSDAQDSALVGPVLIDYIDSHFSFLMSLKGVFLYIAGSPPLYFFRGEEAL